MKKKTVAAVMIMLMVFSLTACGDKKKDEGKAEVAPREEFNTEAQGEFQSISDADFATQNDVDYELYEDTNGWGLYYDKKRIKVDKVDKGAKFTYTGKAAGEDSVTITYEKNKMPREVLAEKFASNPELLKNMEEGYLLEYMTRYCYRVKSTTATASDADADNPYSDAFLDLELSVRSFNCLARSGFLTVADVIKAIRDGTIIQVRNLGRKSLEEIISRVMVVTGMSYEELMEGAINE